jgi:hypothetical protein
MYPTPAVKTAVRAILADRQSGVASRRRPRPASLGACSVSSTPCWVTRSRLVRLEGAQPPPGARSALLRRPESRGQAGEDSWRASGLPRQINSDPELVQIVAVCLKRHQLAGSRLQRMGGWACGWHRLASLGACSVSSTPGWVTRLTWQIRPSRMWRATTQQRSTRSELGLASSRLRMVRKGSSPSASCRSPSSSPRPAARLLVASRQRLYGCLLRMLVTLWRTGDV